MLGKHAKVFFIISISVMIVAIVVAVWGGPAIISRQLQNNLQIENSSLMFEKWRKLPIPLTFKINVFSVVNPDEVNKGEKPILTEVGPYVYKEYREKTILDYGPNDTVKYMLQKNFVFDQEASGELTENDELIVINFSYLAALLAVQDLMPALVPMLNGALEQFFPNLTDPFLRIKVKDLFFDGIFLNCTGDNSALPLVCGKIKSEMPPTMRPSEAGDGFYFSMFNHLNSTPTGPYEMVRGTKNIYDLGKIVSYKGMTTMRQWGDKYCGQLNGTDSSIFPPIKDKHVPERLYTFEPEICRSLYVNLVEPRTIFNDISTYYYEISESALAAKSANPANRCFCRKNWSANHDGCLMMGLLNLMPCQGAPAIASLPHFYLGSEELLEYFGDGLKPDKEKHNSYVYIDPVTGVVLKGVRRLQFNVELRKMPVPQLADVPTGLFPLLWIEEGAEVPDSIQEELRSSHKLIGNVKLVPWIVAGVGLLATLASAVAVVRSGAVPFWPRQGNSVSFMLRPNEAPNTNKIH